MKKQIKALVLLSGGLDSILAVKLLLEQGVEVEAINFRTNFCGPSQARLAAQMLDVPLREVDIRPEFLLILKNPKHGYGAGLNPCVDCHTLMLKKAGQIMRQEGFDFVATGEVLGERPMSQHKQALDIVAKESGLAGYLLRPLSAKLLESTIVEQKGLVDRVKLLSISGRNRKIQMALAKHYGIKEYPTPAGGCALTQKGFVARLKKIMENKPDLTPADVELAAIGRHFFFASSKLPGDMRGEGGPSNTQIILGRNQEENDILAGAAKSGDLLVIPDSFAGPTALAALSGALARGEGGLPSEALAKAGLDMIKELILKFSPKAKNLPPERIKFKIMRVD